MRTVKQIDEYVVFDGAPRNDYTVRLEPCGDTWSGCRYWSK